MPKTRREKILFFTTLVLLIGVLAFTRLKDTNILSAITPSSAEQAGMEKQLNDYLEILSRKDEIEDEFKQIEGQYGAAHGKTPDKQFTEQINKLCLDLGFKGRQLDPPQFAEFPEVPEYNLILLPVSVNGEYAKIVQLLVEIHRMGYLLNQLEIHARQDVDIMKVDFVVARAVKQTEIQATVRTRRGIRR